MTSSSSTMERTDPITHPDTAHTPVARFHAAPVEISPRYLARDAGRPCVLQAAQYFQAVHRVRDAAAAPSAAPSAGPTSPSAPSAGGTRLRTGTLLAVAFGMVVAVPLAVVLGGL